MPNGCVLMFKLDKGYGFIKPDDGSNNVYVHASEVEKAGLESLTEGDTISYDLQDQDGKISAVNLKPV